MNKKIGKFAIIALIAGLTIGCKQTPAAPLSIIEKVQQDGSIEVVQAPAAPVVPDNDWSKFAFNYYGAIAELDKKDTPTPYDGEIVGVPVRAVFNMDSDMGAVLKDLNDYVNLDIVGANEAAHASCHGLVGSGWFQGSVVCQTPAGVKTLELRVIGGTVTDVITYHVDNGKLQSQFEVGGGRISGDFQVFDNTGKSLTYPVEHGIILAADAY